jgi:hypothetical protein
MRPLMIVAATIMAAVTNALAQSERPAPPLLSPAPNLGCQARTSGLVLSMPGETTGSANLSDELSRSKGVICPGQGRNHRRACRAAGSQALRHRRSAVPKCPDRRLQARRE